MMHLVRVMVVMMVMVERLVHYGGRGHGSDHRLLVTAVMVLLLLVAVLIII